MLLRPLPLSCLGPCLRPTSGGRMPLLPRRPQQLGLPWVLRPPGRRLMKSGSLGLRRTIRRRLLLRGRRKLPFQGFICVGLSGAHLFVYCLRPSDSFACLAKYHYCASAALQMMSWLGFSPWRSERPLGVLGLVRGNRVRWSRVRVSRKCFYFGHHLACF